MPSYIIWFPNTCSFLSLCPHSFYPPCRRAMNTCLYLSIKLAAQWLLDSGVFFPLDLLYVTKFGEFSHSRRNPQGHLAKFPAADQFLITHTCVSFNHYTFKYPWDWSPQNLPWNLFLWITIPGSIYKVHIFIIHMFIYQKRKQNPSIFPVNDAVG